MWSELSRRASRAAWSRGCSVFTRPSRISGEPVNSATSVTSRPASRIAAAVPPVDRIWTPSSRSPRAKSTIPVLSETEISAQRTRIGIPPGGEPPSWVIAASRLTVRV